MSQREGHSTRLTALVETATEFDQVMAAALPELLDRATAQTRRFLRETDQWVDDITHEKLALRWGYELLERFLVYGRTEVPCRPGFLLESFIAKYLSQPEPLCYHEDLCSPLGRFIDGLTARAVVSRDALMALFHHLYGLGQGQVVRLLGFGSEEAQRVYKNFERWRRTGWQRTMTEIGMAEDQLCQLEEACHRNPVQFNKDATELVRLIQTHYRKSEPEHFPCRKRQEWAELFEDNYAHDYRVWHLALCCDCLAEVFGLRQHVLPGISALQVDLQVRPLQRRGLLLLFNSQGRHNGLPGRTTRRVSARSH